MGKQVFENNIAVTTASAITNAATTISVATGKGILFAAATDGNWIIATLQSATDVEIVKVTGRSSDDLTVVRGQEGTIAIAWAAASSLSVNVTKGTLEALQINTGTSGGLALSGADPATATGYGVALGNTANATTNAVAIAPGANASGNSAVAVGANSTASALNTVAVGDLAHATQEGNAAIGQRSRDSADQVWTAASPNTDITYLSDVAGTHVFRVNTPGTSASSEPTWNVSTIGATTTDGAASWDYYGLLDTSTNATTVGNQSRVLGSAATALGAVATALQNAVAIGAGVVSGVDCVSVGKGAWAFGTRLVSIGKGAFVSGNMNTAIGYGSDVEAAEFAVQLGGNNGNLISHTHHINGYSLVLKSGNGWNGQADIDYCGQETYIFSNEIDLKTTPTNNIATLPIPAGAHFFPNEFGVLVTSGTAVTVQPQISFGVTASPSALLAQVATTKAAAYGRDIFTPISKDGVATGITASINASATATALAGRFYAKGVLMED